jgi:hypothetical protein
MQMWRWLSVTIALALTGCFVSAGPLITPATADYPLPSEARVEKYHWIGGAWHLAETAELTRTDGYYALRLANGEERFLLKRIDAGKFIAQEESPDRKATRFQYALLLVEGGRIAEYIFSHSLNERQDDECAALAPAEKRRFGIVDTAEGDCAVASADGLRAVFLKLLETAERPKFLYVVVGS